MNTNAFFERASLAMSPAIRCAFHIVSYQKIRVQMKKMMKLIRFEARRPDVQAHQRMGRRTQVSETWFIFGSCFRGQHEIRLASRDSQFRVNGDA